MNNLPNNVKNILVKDLIDVLLVLLGWLIVFIIFTKNLSEGVSLFIGFVIIGVIPGITLVEFSLYKLNTIEKTLVASFIGIWIIPLLMYYTSFFSFKNVNVYFTIVFSIIFLGLFGFKKWKNVIKQLD